MRRYLLWTTVVILALAALVVACGPATQSQSGVGDQSDPAVVFQSDEPTPTPTPAATTTPAPSDGYPTLDETLQKVVSGYEDGTWTEVEAARQAPESHGSTVLIEVYTEADKIDAIDEWMGGQSINPRFKDANYGYSPHIYAYAPVSKLGALSKRDGVLNVFAAQDDNADRREPQVLGQGGSTEPKLPIWLRGYPSPKLSSLLSTTVADSGQGVGVGVGSGSGGPGLGGVVSSGTSLTPIGAIPWAARSTCTAAGAPREP